MQQAITSAPKSNWIPNAFLADLRAPGYRPAWLDALEMYEVIGDYGLARDLLATLTRGAA